MLNSIHTPYDDYAGLSREVRSEMERLSRELSISLPKPKRRRVDRIRTPKRAYCFSWVSIKSGSGYKIIEGSEKRISRVRENSSTPKRRLRRISKAIN